MSQINKHRSPWQVPIGDCDSKTCRKTATIILKQLQKEKLNVQRQRHGKRLLRNKKEKQPQRDTNYPQIYFKKQINKRDIKIATR